MKSENPLDPPVDALIDALRADLPSSQDEVRVRARLAATGLAVGLVLTKTAGASGLAATHALAGVGVSARLAALPWVAKLGAITAVSVTAVATPVWIAQSSDTHSASVSSTASPAPAAPGTPRAAQPKRLRPVAPVAPAPVVAPDGSELLPASTPAAAPVQRAGSSLSRLPARAEAVVQPQPAAGEGAVSPASPSSLGEEARLMDAAFAALRSGERHTALALVAEHASRFPRGLLRRERERAAEKLGRDARSFTHDAPAGAANSSSAARSSGELP
ncbi:MAG TPA: hypothetical protein VER33_01625 [Polyangiaceae bacterium]|nr:hypothetical protein [Polyangiaceae bacterium]